MVLSELILVSVTPSNTARGGGIIHPIVLAISTSYDSDLKLQKAGWENTCHWLTTKLTLLPLQCSLRQLPLTH